MTTALLSPFLVVVSMLLLSATAAPLGVRADPPNAEDKAAGPATDGPDGHMNHRWVVAVAVSLVLIILAVAGTIIFVKLRQQQRRRESRRTRRNYTRTSDDSLVWRGPYASRASYTRSPSPPSPAHLSEKDKSALATKR